MRFWIPYLGVRRKCRLRCAIPCRVMMNQEVNSGNTRTKARSPELRGVEQRRAQLALKPKVAIFYCPWQDPQGAQDKGKYLLRSLLSLSLV